MARKCSCCGDMGHNLRTCITHKMSLTGNKYFRLFGVQLDLSSSSSSSSASSSFVMRRSFSMDGLSNWFTPSSSSSSDLTTDGKSPQCNEFISDGVVTTRNRKIKKGVQYWSEEEHLAFLAGLEKLGKGNWRGISTNFVTTRTPIQVASHAQKHFLRQIKTCPNKRKRSRPSLFDVRMMPKFTPQIHSSSSTEASVDPLMESSSKITSSAAQYLTAAVLNHRSINGRNWPF
ncbi:transcription factor MYBS3-like [Juglans microcarpa x Juglans regia]|uniref:transcription factor MYBS3-like n=1 Tax=Juglans microcarpa x Juglans regia TaxID=2249226 RepID=UPI001B7E9593|nr:transcription factor MYBS3-like [Juglans microcarpa x Juglans regia]